MKKIIWTIVSVILVASMLMSIPASAAWTWTWTKTNQVAPDKDKYAFSFALVGDTQTLSTLDAGTHKTMEWGYSTTEHINKGYMSTIYTWIANNVEEKKIAHVFGLGDITQNRNTAEGKKEFEAAKQAWSVLNGKVPYSLVRGNHDSMPFYQQYVCDDEYIAQFDGVYKSGTNVGRSTYKKLEIEGMKFLLLSLDFGANDAVLNWACDVVEAHPDHKVIVSTHGYLADKTRRTSAEKNDYISSTDGGYNLGEAIWQKLVKKYDNMLMVLCGHMYADPMAMRTVKGDNGNTVYEIMFNPQDYDEWKEPSGMVAMLYFSKDGKNCWLEHYSTIKDQYCKLNTVRIPFATPLLPETTSPATTVVPDTTAPETTAEAKSDGCGALIFMPALPVSIGCTAFALRKRKAKISK